MHKSIPAAIAAIGITLAAAPALAGPCSNDIADLSRRLTSNPTLGGSPTSGALSGAEPGHSPSPTGGGAAGGSSATNAGSPDRMAGTSADRRQGGTAGTREMNATVNNQIATSPEDVRRQQQGQPTAAAQAEAGKSGQTDRNRVEVTPNQHAAAAPQDDRASRAKSELETARALDQRDDAGCRDAVNRVRSLM